MGRKEKGGVTKGTEKRREILVNRRADRGKWGIQRIQLEGQSISTVIILLLTHREHPWVKWDIPLLSSSLQIDSSHLLLLSPIQSISCRMVSVWILIEEGKSPSQEHVYNTSNQSHSTVPLPPPPSSLYRTSLVRHLHISQSDRHTYSTLPSS